MNRGPPKPGPSSSIPNSLPAAPLRPPLAEARVKRPRTRLATRRGAPVPNPHSEIAPAGGVSKDPPVRPYYDVAPERTL
jgi:hypothetical protein